MADPSQDAARNGALQHLPNEILCHAVDKVDDLPTLQNLRLSCRLIKYHLDKRFFSRFTLRPSSNNFAEKLKFLNRPEISRHVKTLELDAMSPDEPCQEMDVRGTPFWVELSDEIEKIRPQERSIWANTDFSTLRIERLVLHCAIHTDRLSRGFTWDICQHIKPAYRNYRMELDSLLTQCDIAGLKTLEIAVGEAYDMSSTVAYWESYVYFSNTMRAKFDPTKQPPEFTNKWDILQRNHASIERVVVNYRKFRYSSTLWAWILHLMPGVKEVSFIGTLEMDFFSGMNWKSSFHDEAYEKIFRRLTKLEIVDAIIDGGLHRTLGTCSSLKYLKLKDVGVRIYDGRRYECWSNPGIWYNDHDCAPWSVILDACRDAPCLSDMELGGLYYCHPPEYEQKPRPYYQVCMKDAIEWRDGLDLDHRICTNRPEDYVSYVELQRAFGLISSEDEVGLCPELEAVNVAIREQRNTYDVVRYKWVYDEGKAKWEYELNRPPHVPRPYYPPEEELGCW